jgi:hypothetical protein
LTTAEHADRTVSPFDLRVSRLSFGFDGSADAPFDVCSRWPFLGQPIVARGGKSALKSMVFHQRRFPFSASDTLRRNDGYKQEAGERLLVSGKPAGELAALLFNLCLNASQRRVDGCRTL